MTASPTTTLTADSGRLGVESPRASVPLQLRLALRFGGLAVLGVAFVAAIGFSVLDRFAADSVDAAFVNAARLTLLGCSAAMLGMVLGGLWAANRFVRRRIAEPAMELVRAAEAVASGDLSVSVAHAGRDEIGRLARALSIMIASMRRLADALAVLPQELLKPPADA